MTDASAVSPLVRGLTGRLEKARLIKRFSIRAFSLVCRVHAVPDSLRFDLTSRGCPLGPRRVVSRQLDAHVQPSIWAAACRRKEDERDVKRYRNALDSDSRRPSVPTARTTRATDSSCVKVCGQQLLE